MQIRNKQYSRGLLLVGATAIVALTLWSSGHIAKTLRQEEQRKVELWSEAIVQRAQLVGYTEDLFTSLRNEERDKADLMGEAYRIIQEADPGAPIDLTFITRFIQANRTIPVLVYKDSVLQADINVAPSMQSPMQLDSLRDAMSERGSVIEFDQGLTLFYDQSNRFRDLQTVMDDIIHSFISETVLNSASIPVLLADSNLSTILRADRFDQVDLSDTLGLIAKLMEVNPPIALDLPDAGRRWILYDESIVLKQLRFFPVVQLLIIGGFLLLAYSTFSAFRRSEQNRVWVGMAKETAHQLGTPLSALMAWVEVLRSEGVAEEVLVELGKDLDRLGTVTDRFSKIGSEPELTPGDLRAFVSETMAYLERRMPRAVHFNLEMPSSSVEAAFNPALFGWVLENLTKNAVDAMEGSGELDIRMWSDSGRAIMDIRDTGRGMSRRVQRQVFDPGFSTKKRGWGLGLSLVRRIVGEYHGGQIVILRSEEGVGTTFRVSLPAYSAF
ncbi:HAMP domain-containing histidine kinase [Flavobacteriales bacterium]|nr:HAMP domain-containing histidine kinase [Flavobacteriales bacterium]